ncbi:hypothetical protein SGLAM104S_04165 [Streptomyces glaucescens]
MLTTEAMWSRPIRMAARYRPRQPIAGLASCSSHTAEVCVTVTSSSTPSEPMMTPASSRPLMSIDGYSPWIRPVLSSVLPVSAAQPMSSEPRRPISNSEISVPRTATDVRADRP